MSPTRRKTRRLRFQMFHHLPKEGFGHGRRPLPIGCDSPLRLGGVAPRIVESGPECKGSEPPQSFRPIQWLNWASSRLTTWLHGLKLRDLSSAPLSRATLKTRGSGMRLQIWRKTLNRRRVGLILFIFRPALWQVSKRHANTFSFPVGWML